VGLNSDDESSNLPRSCFLSHATLAFGQNPTVNFKAGKVELLSVSVVLADSNGKLSFVVGNATSFSAQPSGSLDLKTIELP
jgi:hypothetical protein